MKERIIVIPHSSCLGKSLAYHGVSLFNIRFLTPIQLAKYVQTRQALNINKSYINYSEELSYYVGALKGNEYFKSQKLLDINKIKSSIDSIRELIAYDEESELRSKLSKGIFTKKNAALLEVYRRYLNELEEENKLDEIAYIRCVLESCDKLDVNIFTIKELPLSPLVKALIDKLTDGSTIETDLKFLLHKDNPNIRVHSYRNCYGSSNEVAMAICDIYKNHKLDETLLALGDLTYSQIIFDYVCKYNIPVSFGCGIPITNSYPGRLLKQYNYWSTSGNFGSEPFYQLISSPYFDGEKLSELIVYDDERDFNISKFWETISKLRLTNDKQINAIRVKEYEEAVIREIGDNEQLRKYVGAIDAVAKELSLPVQIFIEKYAITRSDNELLHNLDVAAKKVIIDEINIVNAAFLKIDADIIEDILHKFVLRQLSEPGKLHVCSIEDAITSIRKNLYVLGLSSNVYPGSPKENPLLLDDDLQYFDDDTLTSSGKIALKKKQLLNLIYLASGLNNEINLSYPGLNVSELKNNNASSLLFEIFKLENGEDARIDDFQKQIINVGYFEPGLSNSTKIGEEYNVNSNIMYEENISDNASHTKLQLKRYSPSSLNTFYNCRKAFLYQYLLKVPQPDDYNPYEIISASDCGTLAHSLMEYLSKHEMDRDNFLKLAENSFDDYMKIAVPLVGENIEQTKTEFVETMDNGWQMDNRYNREVLVAEKDLEVKHPSGITIHGFPDRVEIENNKAIIVDFKTGRNIEHVKDDIETCLQTIIYAYIIENKLGYEIDHCEYRYLRRNKIVTCKYDEEMKAQLNDLLMVFKQAIDNCDYKIDVMDKDEEKERCKYCKYGAICGKEVKN